MPCEIVLDRFELADSCLRGIKTADVSSNDLVTRKLQLTLEAAEIGWPPIWNNIPPMAQLIQLALGAFRSNHGVKSHTTSWEAQECAQQCGQNESPGIVIS